MTQGDPPQPQKRMQQFPPKILFLSDSTEMELIEEVVVKKGADRIAKYRFTKAQVNTDKLCILSLSQIEKLLSEKLIEVT